MIYCIFAYQVELLFYLINFLTLQRLHNYVDVYVFIILQILYILK